MPNRYVCDVIKEMRTAVKVGRIDMIRGLTEELQTLVNRMEAKLADYADMGYDLRRASDFKTRLKQMKKEAELLDEKLDGGDDTVDEFVTDIVG